MSATDISSLVYRLRALFQANSRCFLDEDKEYCIAAADSGLAIK
jgi:hypothetical protein